ncbi:MAG: hypothetical protein EXR65_04345 [Dehalococcoidia bacterium]|nr:hypothetical protein [Dehalococcoidia bacterium]
MTAPFSASVPASLAIVDPRLDLAAIVSAIAGELRPDMPVGMFAELDEGQAWIERTDRPVLVLADVSVMDEMAMGWMRDWAIPAADLILIPMFDATMPDEEDRARAIGSDRVLMKPVRPADWRAVIARYLGLPTPPGRASGR